MVPYATIEGFPGTLKGVLVSRAAKGSGKGCLGVLQTANPAFIIKS